MEHTIRTPKQLGEALLRARKAQNLTQTDIGSKARIKQGTVSRVEHGQPGTEIQTIFDILAALDMECTVRPRTKGENLRIEDFF